LQKYLDQAITWARYVGAVWRSRTGHDTLIARYRATSSDQIFTIIGPGGTLNDLSEADFQRIEAGVSACINMAGVAPIAFDIYSIEAIADPHQANSLAAKMQSQSKPAMFWHQNRSKHDTAHIRMLTQTYPTHSYIRASVSFRRRLDSFHHVFRTVLRPRIFDRPNLRVNFALTGSVARLVLLACALGYRRIAFAGIDLGATRYFWQEATHMRGQPVWMDVNGSFDPAPTATSFQGIGGRVVPNLFEFLRCLKTDSGVALEFTTIDPKGRSALTEFLNRELNA
jgi:hypothetical protein